MIRLYFNKRGELPWSVDSGPGTEERKFESVVINIAGVTHTRALDAGEDPEKVPSAWIQFNCAELDVLGRIAVIRKAS